MHATDLPTSTLIVWRGKGAGAAKWVTSPHPKASQGDPTKALTKQARSCRPNYSKWVVTAVKTIMVCLPKVGGAGAWHGNAYAVNSPTEQQGLL